MSAEKTFIAFLQKYTGVRGWSSVFNLASHRPGMRLYIYIYIFVSGVGRSGMKGAVG